MTSTLADKLAEEDVEKLGHTLSNVEHNSLVDTLPDTLAYSETETIRPMHE